MRYNVAGNGERDSLKSMRYEAISSQASAGKGAGEGSEARRVTPKNNLSHECPATYGSKIWSEHHGDVMKRSQVLRDNKADYVNVTLFGQDNVQLIGPVLR